MKRTQSEYKAYLDKRLAKYRVGGEINLRAFCDDLNDVLRRFMSEDFYVVHDNDPNVVFVGLTYENGQVHMNWQDMTGRRLWTMGGVNPNQVDLERKMKKVKMYADFGMEMI